MHKRGLDAAKKEQGSFLESPGNLTGPKSYFEICLKKPKVYSDL